ncbi:MAG: response regulator transcription factor [Patescibacteria group bacterium]
MRILIIEDDEIIAVNLKTMLSRHAFAVDTACDGKMVIQLAGDEEYDLIIMDWMLPDTNGPTLCQLIRKNYNTTPILMLTAKSQIDDRVKGLGSGADDYLTKPFAFSELLARIEALLRRRDKVVVNPTLEIQDLSINTNTHEVTRSGKLIPLSPKEYALLHYLALHKSKAIDRLTLLSHAWDEQADLFSNTVDVHIATLRKKIGAGTNKKYITTVKGLGYMLCEN